MLIYRQFKKEMEESRKSLAFLETTGVKKSDSTMKSAIERVSVLSEINRFVDSFEWVASEKSLSKIRLLIENKFDYVGVSKLLGISESSLYVTFSRADQRLKRKIETPLSLILDGKYGEGLNVYRLSSNELSLYEYNLKLPFLESVINLPSSKSEVDIDWTQAVNALKFLKIYSKPQMELGLRNSGELLQNVLYILFSGDTEFTYEQQIILGFIESKTSLKETIDALVAFQSILSSSNSD